MDDEPIELALVMPSRELFRLSGWRRDIDLRVLESLQGESWFADPATALEDFNVRQVLLGVVVVRRADGGGEALVGETGTLLHIGPVPPEVERMGKGLAGLKNLARAAAMRLAAAPGSGTWPIELVGCLHEPGLAECRSSFVLAYRLAAPEGHPAPAGWSWVAIPRLASIPLDALSTLALDAVQPPTR